MMTLRDPMDKIMTWDEAAQWRSTLHEEGRKLVVTNGCFDLMHRGHATYLQQARACGDALLVAINSDASVQAIKGPLRPLVSEQDRAYLLASLECVDAVVVFDAPQATGVFEKIPADIYAKGGDYTEETLDREEYAALKAGGAQVRFIPFVDGLSTSALVEKIIKTH
jgi:rfaE bifunctional protein nucleotidyltransferase chain/domain